MSITTTVTNDTTTGDDGTGRAGLTQHYALPGVPWLAALAARKAVIQVERHRS